MQVSFRLDEETAKALEEIAAKESAATGYAVSRTDVAKRALREWIEGRTKGNK